MKYPTLTLCIVARNEESALPALLRTLQMQTYPSERIQLLLVDSMSTDLTRQIMSQFAEENADSYHEIKILENIGIKLANGWNVALAHANGDLIMRMDAHAEFPQDYISLCVSHIVEGENIVGGKVLNLAGADTDEAFVTNMIEDSLFGGSIAAFRHAEIARYVDTLAFAVYRRSIFEEVGFFDERLARTEDNEMHYRMRKAGYRFYYNPEIVSWRRTRPSFIGLVKQKYLNGFWIGMTVPISPHCFDSYHFVPAVFVIALAILIILAVAGYPRMLELSICMYLSVTLLMSITAIASAQKRPLLCIFMPAMFFILHVVYGVGTLIGLIKSVVSA